MNTLEPSILREQMKTNDDGPEEDRGTLPSRKDRKDDAASIGQDEGPAADAVDGDHSSPLMAEERAVRRRSTAKAWARVLDSGPHCRKTANTRSTMVRLLWGRINSGISKVASCKVARIRE